jgi:spermidine synthase
MLTLGLGASTHSFEVMLAAFILGMSLGAFWIRNRIQRMGNDGLWLAGLLVAKAVFAVYAIWIYGDVLEFIRWTMSATARTDAGYTVLMVSSLLASMAVMLPTAICAGMTLPLATYALTNRGYGEASIGRVYGANTAGCILGAAFATHFGMEAMGLKGLTGLGALMDVGVALAVFFFMAGLRGVRAFAPAAIVVALAGAVYLTTEMDLVRMASGVFRFGTFDDPATSKIAFYRDGKTATISVIERGSVKSIRTNGKADASVEFDASKQATMDEATMMLAAALPLSMKPGAQEIANIGFGSGLTTHTLLGSPNVKVVDSIEIERMMLEGARLFAPRNSRAYQDPRSKLHVEDAKTFFASAGKRYDIIVSEPSNPWISGVSTLFSDEFYTRVKPYLKDDGLFVQWIQAYEINVGLLSSIFQALGKNFGDYALFSHRGSDLFVIATPAARLPALGADVFRFPGVSEDMDRLGYRRLEDLQVLRVGGKRTFAPLFAATGFPVNSDFYPLIDQRAPRARFKRETAEDLRRLRDQLVPALALFEGDLRQSPGELGRVTLNRPQRPEQVLTAAQAIGAFVDGDKAPAPGLPLGFRLQMLAGHGLLASCAGAQREFMEVVSEVVRVSAPYVDRGTLEPMFVRVRASPCYRQLDEAGPTHLALLEAINARDAEGMAAAGEAMLKLVPESDAERGQFVMAAMAGHLARGRVAEAARVHEANHRVVAPMVRDGVLYNLLVAQVKAAGQARPGAAVRGS